jgi:F-type H+-transporting ATPase subunit gamma
MASLEFLQRQIHTAEELKAIVNMMKVLAAVNINQYEHAVTSLSEYTRTIKMGLHVVLKSIHTNHNLLTHIPLVMEGDKQLRNRHREEIVALASRRKEI